MWVQVSIEACCVDTEGLLKKTLRANQHQHPLQIHTHAHTHQLLPYGAEQLVTQGPGLRPRGKLGQNPPCKVADPHLHLGVLQESHDVLQQVLVQQVRL